MKHGNVRKWLVAAAVLAMPVGFGQETTLETVLRELQTLQAKVQAQQVEIEKLKAQLQKGSVSKEAVEQVVDEKLKEAKGAPIHLGNANIDNLKIKGDLRVRYERRTKDTGSSPNTKENRDRLRTRFRLGLVWTNSAEDWEIGAGLASGGDDGRSTNDTWSEKKVFETGDLRLDYAYAKHKWDNMSITLGQQKNPFVTSYILWDGDLRPTGFTLQAHSDSVFATLGYYDALWGANLQGNADDYSVEMYAGQLGVKGEIENGLGFLAAAGVYMFTDSFREATAGGTNPYPNSKGLYSVSSNYDVHLGDIYAQVTDKVGGVGVKAYGHVVKNFGAAGNQSQQTSPAGIDPSGNDLAWLLGLSFKQGKLRLGYSYAHIEADSVFGPMKDSDFGETAGLADTNVEGHKLGLSYLVTEHFSLGATAMFLSEIKGNKDGQLYQFDANYKF